MDSSFFLATFSNGFFLLVMILTTFATAVGLFTLFRKFRFHQERNEMDSSSVSPSPPPSLSSHKWTHDVFPSFRGEDVRVDFLSHIQKEFRRKGITPFIDNEISRGDSIGPELIRAIRGSKIAVVLLSRNYASSKWCLDELVEIMDCREKLGQIVVPIFYKVDSTDIKKQTADFGKVFRKTCSRKTKEDIGRWKQALERVATIAGYHSNNWDNEAAMIEKITTDVSNKLNNSTLSNDFKDLVGMGAHMEKMEEWLCLDIDEVKMIGIWGPSGIGKTTIARFLFNQHSNSFELSVFMENIKAFMYTRPACSDDYSLKLHLHKQFMSQIFDQKDIEIPHLGVAHDRLKDKRVLVVLDDVDRLFQLDAMAKETRWFGRGSRIIITTQDRRLLRAHGIEDIYKVEFPETNEALQIFCLHAFGQKSPEDGFEELALEVTHISGKLPLALRVMGSYFRGMSKQEWTEALPRLRTHLDSDIQSILKFSYDALDDEDKYLFLHIACFFGGSPIDQTLEETLGKNFSNMRHRLCVLAEKSLISIDRECIKMHDMLTQLGIEIVRKQSIHEPGHRQFLVDVRDICEVLTEDTGSRSVLGIQLKLSEIEKDVDISEKAFQGMPNLQFLNIYGAIHDEYSSLLSPHRKKLHIRGGLNYLPRKLRILHWEDFQITSLPSEFHTEYLVELYMPRSMLEKLWEGIRPLRNLRWLDLQFSENLKELPELSTATNLQDLNLYSCSRLVELPSSIGNASNLKDLILSGCSSLVKLPSTIGNAINLEKLKLEMCYSLLELPYSIVNATNLKELYLSYCTSLKELPSSIGNASNLELLNLRGCSSLVKLPSTIGNAINLQKLILEMCSSLLELPYSIVNATNLKELYLSDCTSLKELPSSIGNTSNLELLNLRGCSSLVKLPSTIGNAINLQKLILEMCSSLLELPSSIGNASSLELLNLVGCSALLELPYTIGNATSLTDLYLIECKSLKELPSSIGNLYKLQSLRLDMCSKLEVLPININLESLDELVLAGCSSLKIFPEISTNIKYLRLVGTAVEEVPSSIKSWSRLQDLEMPYSENLKRYPHALEIITELDLSNSEIQEVMPWIKKFSRLYRLTLEGCRKLVSLPQLPDSLLFLNAKNCESLERLDCSFHNPEICLNFGNCFKLNQEARDLIIKTPTNKHTVLPCEEVPAYFSEKANGVSVTVKLDERPLHRFLRFKACILLVDKGEHFDCKPRGGSTHIEVKQNGSVVTCRTNEFSLPPSLTEHLYTFEIEAEVTSSELVFDFKFDGDRWEIRECGLLQLLEVPRDRDCEKSCHQKSFRYIN